jgi:hypothetical protein
MSSRGSSNAGNVGKITGANKLHILMEKRNGTGGVLVYVAMKPSKTAL